MATTANKKTKTIKSTKRKSASSNSQAASTATAKKTEDGFIVSLGSSRLSTADIKAVVTDSAFATLGAGDYAITVARELPSRLDSARKDGAAQVKQAPVKAQTFVREAPGRLQHEVNEALDIVRDEIDSYATRGRKVVNTISNAESTKTAMSQTDTARSQVKGAVTSIRKAARQSQVAVGDAANRIGLRRSA